METKAYYTTREVANIFEVTPFTARKWCRDGLMKAKRLPGGQFRVAFEDLKDFADNKYGETRSGSR